MNARHLLFPLLLGGLCSVTEPSNGQAFHNTQPQHLCFIENKGQVTDQYSKSRKDINFRVGGSGLSMFAGSGQLHYQWATPTATRPDVFNTYRMDVELVGADPQAKVVTEQLQPYFERHYLPQSGEEAATAHAYRKITYKEVYPKIDWVLYIKSDNVEYDFVVRPGGKVSDIKLKYSGATHLSISKSGNLTATTPMGTVSARSKYIIVRLAYGRRKKRNKVHIKIAVHPATIRLEVFLYPIKLLEVAALQHALRCARCAAGLRPLQQTGSDQPTFLYVLCGCFQLALCIHDLHQPVRVNLQPCSYLCNLLGEGSTDSNWNVRVIYMNEAHGSFLN